MHRKGEYDLPEGREVLRMHRLKDKHPIRAPPSEVFFFLFNLLCIATMLLLKSQETAFVCLCGINVCTFLCDYLCIVLLWSDTWCGCVVPPISASRLPSCSFYRKLIGSCHWCVKLFCIRYGRQLDYLFVIYSILEQMPSCFAVVFKLDLLFLCSIRGYCI